MVCHDIPAGLLEDPLIQTDFSASYGYRFTRWNNIDMFIYFGHHRVTFPPPAWIATAHRHGVKILGTLIFEWKEGADESVLLLTNTVSHRGKTKSAPAKHHYARQLVRLAKHCGFDGYLMNFESSIPKDLVPKLIEFL